MTDKDILIETPHNARDRFAHALDDVTAAEVNAFPVEKLALGLKSLFWLT
ncbi:hypothetical protein ACVRWB_04455 [Streptococcus troglodytae]|uniref:Uncharacterized protein n=1 Tax=Streptococcus troglodytae TaxID=1111760 RepID=A0A1L7LKB1_9STRE|nr:hypothetical protein [Streptococcus troglodytae]BAQ24472.1 putative uncharacterized protein [Streptococcus troglodytae]